MMNNHFQEPTMVSTTETVVERGENNESPSRAPSISPFTGSGIQTTVPESPHTQHPTRREGTLDPRSMPPVIPPTHEHRTLVLCFDGTGDQFDADNSNIVQLVSLLKKNDANKQMVYYQVIRLFYVHTHYSLLAGWDWNVYVFQGSHAVHVQHSKGRSPPVNV
jgi:hypothetical protein